MHPNFNVIRSYSLSYLATPYSKYVYGNDMSFVHSSIITGQLLKDGVQRVFSPIVHCHPIAQYAGINRLDNNIWMNRDGLLYAMMEKSDALLVAQLPGWQDSVGVGKEIKFFEKSNKPIHYLPEEYCVSALF